MKKSRTLSAQELLWQKNLKRIWLEKKPELGLSQESAALAAGWKTQSAFNQFLNGKLALNTDAIIRMSRVLGVSPAEINPSLADHFANNRPVNTETVTKVAVITWDTVGKLCSSIRPFEKDEVEAWMLCPTEHSEAAYYLRVSGESMSHEYADGDMILVDPLVDPAHGDDVVVKLPDSPPVLKRLHITQDGRHLESLNPSWPNRITQWADGSEICGVVISMTRPKARRR